MRTEAGTGVVDPQNVPVLLLLFNRVEEPLKVVNTLRDARCRRVYLAQDGPRPGHPTDELQILETRQRVLQAIDWITPKTLWRAENMGCRRAVSSAISWLFENEREGIILEDDCVPASDFFRFCSVLLHRYRCDERVMTISGSNFQDGQVRGSYSYYFSRLPHCWGWATWRRAWKKYTETEDILSELLDHPYYWNCQTPNRWANRYRRWFTRRALEAEVDSWAAIWGPTNLFHAGLTIQPNVNLVSNVGVGSEATHTNVRDPRQFRELGTLDFPLADPPHMIPDRVADDYVYKHHYRLILGPLSHKLTRALPPLARLKRFLSRAIRTVGELFSGSTD